MKYTTQRLTDFSQIESLYKSRLEKDFTEDERKPLSSMKRSWEEAIMIALDCYVGKKSLVMRSSSAQGITACWIILL